MDTEIRFAEMENLRQRQNSAKHSPPVEKVGQNTMLSAPPGQARDPR
jgi:hypothetical protein